jgi:2-oxoglutarate dehydrogenase E1 component
MAEGHFMEVLDDKDIDKSKIDTLVLCSGKFYYEAKVEAEKRGVENAAFIRMEQMYPFPEKQLKAVLDTYSNAKKKIWAQEEPENMGPWSYVAMKLRGEALDIVSRKPSSAPAAGSSETHKRRLEDLFNGLFHKIAAK